MLIASRNGFAVRKSILPPGARWVEYLGFDSYGHYINPNFYPAADMEVYGKFFINILPNHGWQIALGSGWGSYWGSACSPLRVAPFGDCTYDFGGRYPSTGISTDSTGKWLEVRLTKTNSGHQYTLDSYSSTITNLINFPDRQKFPILIGAVSYPNGSSVEAGWTADFFCYEGTKIGPVDLSGGGVVRRLRPIAIGNTGYMLDLVTGDYLQYGNAGTGAFVIGPNKVTGGVCLNGVSFPVKQFLTKTTIENCSNKQLWQSKSSHSCFSLCTISDNIYKEAA